MARSTTLHYDLSTADLEDRFSPAVLVDIFDDDNDGTPDPAPLLRLLLDAQSYVEGALRHVYDLSTLRGVDPWPNEIVRFILDRAEARAYVRHPEHARFDGYKMLDRVDKELTDLCNKGKRRLDADGSPEPAYNQGGVTSSSVNDPDFPEPAKIFFGGGFGYF